MKSALLFLVLLILSGCPTKEPTPQDIFKASDGVYVQSFQRQEELGLIKFTMEPNGDSAAGGAEHQISFSCDSSPQNSIEVPLIERVLGLIKDNFILIAASIALI